MPWLGFSFAKRPAATATKKNSQASAVSSSSSKSVSKDSEFDLDDDFDSSNSATDEKPQIRLLSPAEVEKMQSENEQLKKLIENLMAEKAKSSSSSAAAYPDLSASASSNSNSRTTLTFQKVVDVNSVLNHTANSSAPSAPPLESLTRRASGSASAVSAASLSPQELAPVDNFYASLRKSLAASNASASTSTNVKLADSKPMDEDEFADDYFGGSPAAAPAVPDSITQPRTEDVAVVHNKHSSVIIHKKPIIRSKDDDDDSGATVSKPTVTSTSMDDFDDDFGTMAGDAAVSAAAVDEEVPEDEVAIFNVENADWWLVVPHPDRIEEELVSAPEPPLDPNEDEDGFVVVKNKDSIAALGEFISAMMAKHPEIRKLSPEQLKQMLEESLVEHGIKQPSTTFGKAWQVGKQIYNIYSYGAWGLSLYQNQTVMRLAAAGIIKAASWTCVFLI